MSHPAQRISGPAYPPRSRRAVLPGAPSDAAAQVAFARLFALGLAPGATLTMPLPPGTPEGPHAADPCRANLAQPTIHMDIITVDSSALPRAQRGAAG